MWLQRKTPRRRREALLLNLGFVRGWQATLLAADSGLGISQLKFILRPVLHSSPLFLTHHIAAID
jgi:hypothetical protein